jgi:hypothetical protein
MTRHPALDAAEANDRDDERRAEADEQHLEHCVGRARDHVEVAKGFRPRGLREDGHPRAPATLATAARAERLAERRPRARQAAPTITATTTTPAKSTVLRAGAPTTTIVDVIAASTGNGGPNGGRFIMRDA